jgi:hypothetical protein
MILVLTNLRKSPGITKLNKRLAEIENPVNIQI